MSFRFDGAMRRRLTWLLPLVGALVVAFPAGAAPGVDLAVTVADTAAKVQAGDHVRYSIRVALVKGSLQQHLRVVVRVPASLRDVRFSSKHGRYERSTGWWRGVALTRRAPLVLTVSGRVSAGTTGAVVLRAHVYAARGTIDANRSNDAAADVNAVAGLPKRADLSVTVDDGRGEILAGSPTTYTVTVRNRGPSAVVGARIRLILPSQLRSHTVAASTGGYDSVAAAWQGINLTAGSSATLTVSGSIADDAAGPVALRGEIVSSGSVIDAMGENDAASDTTTVIAASPSPSSPPPPTAPPPAVPAADFGVTVTKTGTSPTYTFTFTVTNHGPSVGPMSARFHFTMGTIKSVQASRGTFDQVWNWTDPTYYVPGEIATLTMVIELPLPDPVSLTVTGGLLDPNPANNTATG